MNYELAKKLKEAGFSQSGPSLSYGEVNVEVDEGGIVTVNSVYVPALEELIGACGDKFVSVYNNGTDWLVNEEAGSEVPQVRGETLTEAVANLWLALNKVQ